MSERKKQKPEEKVKIVKRYLAGEVSMSEAVTEAGVNWKTLQKWVMQYEAEGAAAFLPGRREHIYSPELKLQAEFSKKYGLRDRRQLRNWLKVYNAHGDLNSRKNSGGSYMRQGRDTTQGERIQIVKDCLASGKNYSEMALKYKVSYQQVRTWTLRFEEMGEAGLEDRRGKRKKDQVPRTELEKAQIEIEQLKHKLYLAEMERDLLKKLDEIERRDAFRK